MALLSPTQSLVLVIDIQERLAPVIHDVDGVVSRTGVLLQAAQHLDVPALAFEQYSRGLGATLPALARYISNEAVIEKMAFSVATMPSVLTRLAATSRTQIVIAGMEAHVCVLQSAFGLKEAGYEVHVVADAVGSRRARDVDLAFSRLRMEGIGITNCEMVVYEWMRHAEMPHFKTLSRLLRD
ncbi:isochorismatase family protein [Aquabacter sp. CN5-332]|uniref:isochorismatase family protein n=1 Tax=Aquabacter sp. CN5-332 TaxID=3156608 RepID=UPI0032B41959